MATDQNSGAQQGGSQIIGQATIVYGTVQVISPEGVTRTLQPNDPIHLGDRVLTGGNGAVSIVFNDAGQTRLDLGRMTDMVIDQEVLGGAAPEDIAAAAAEVEQIQQALLAGETFDPTTDLEAPAAGPATGVQEAGGGQITVRFDRNNQEVTPEAGAETIGIGRSFLDPEAGILGLTPPGPPPFIPPVAPPAPAPAPAPTVSVSAVEVPDAPPPDDPDTIPTAGPLVTEIDEAHLLNGTDPGSGPTTVSGTLSFNFGPDTPGILVFGSQQIVIDNSGDSITVPGTYNDLVINDDGTYSYTLSENIDHPTAGATGSDDVLSEIFSFIAYDSDGTGSTGAPGSLTINILDDGPEVIGDTTRVVEEEAMDLFESPDGGAGIAYPTLSQGNPDEEDGPEDSDFNDPFQNDVRQVTGDLNEIINLGADDDLPAASFTIDGTKLEGLPALVSQGGQVLYRMNANGTTLEAYVEGGGSGEISSLDLSQVGQIPPGENEFAPGERIVFTLDVQPDGTYTFSVYDQLDHIEGDGENTGLQIFESDGSVDSIDFSTVISGTDSDFDPIPGLPDEAFNFIVVDDVPELVPLNPEQPEYPEQGGEELGVFFTQLAPETGIARFQVQEDALGQDTDNSLNNPDDDRSTGNLDSDDDTDSAVYNLNALVKPGADENLSWSLVEPETEEPGEVEVDIDPPPGIPSGLTSKGEDVYYRIDGNTLTAFTASVDNVFTFSVDAVTGLAVFNLNDQLDHPDGAGDTATLSIENLGQFVRATDFDGDSVDLVGRLKVEVENDAPEQGGKPVLGIVDEDDLDTALSTGTDDDDPAADGPLVVAQGSLSSVISSGADEPVTFNFAALDDNGSMVLTAEAEAALESQGLQSQGDDLFYQISTSGALEGRAENDIGEERTVFWLELNEDGNYRFVLQDQLDHPEGDGENSLTIDFSAVVNATDFDKDMINLGDLDFDGKPAFRIEVVDDVPEVKETASLISATVIESALDPVADAPIPDNADGTDGPGSGDEASGGNLSELFESGSDEPLSFSLATEVGELPVLYSGGQQLAYEVIGNEVDGYTLVARAGDAAGPTVFTFTVESDGTWNFDLQDALDHEAGDGENLELVGESETVDGIDLSSLIRATDYDGDTVAATPGTFVIKVQDDTPEFGTPQDAILANEDGNSLVADLNIDYGADGPATSVLPLQLSGPEDGDGYVINNEGSRITSNGENLVYQDDGNGGLIAVTEGDGREVFRVSLDQSAGTYSVAIIDVIDGRSGAFFDFTSMGNLKSGNEDFLDFISEDGETRVRVTGDNQQNGPSGAVVNTSNQGMGVGNNSVDDNDDTGPSESLTFAFFDTEGTSGPGQEGDDTDKLVTKVSFTVDKLDDPPNGTPEILHWEAYKDGGLVGSGQVSGSGQGASSQSDQGFAIDVNDPGGTGPSEAFDSVKIYAEDGTEFRILTLEIETEAEAIDHIITYEVTATDNDGDQVSEDFDVTFDADGDIEGTAADEVIAGSSGDDIIDAGAGDDIVLAGDGDDTVDGGAGNDIIEGGDGNDVLHGGADDDTVVGGDGEDQVSGGEGDDTVYGNAEPPAASDGAEDTFDDSDVPSEYADYDSGEDDIDALVPPVDPIP